MSHRAREFGQSKYGLSRAFRVVVDLPFGEQQRFEIPLGETLEIEAEATDENRVAQLLGWVRWALLALFVLSVVLVAINYLLDRRYARMAPEKRPARMRSRVPGAEVGAAGADEAAA